MPEKKISIMIRPWLSDSIDFPRSPKRFDFDGELAEYSPVLMDVPKCLSIGLLSFVTVLLMA